MYRKDIFPGKSQLSLSISLWKREYQYLVNVYTSNIKILTNWLKLFPYLTNEYTRNNKRHVKLYVWFILDVLVIYCLDSTYVKSFDILLAIQVSLLKILGYWDFEQPLAGRTVGQMGLASENLVHWTSVVRFLPLGRVGEGRSSRKIRKAKFTVPGVMRFWTTVGRPYGGSNGPGQWKLGTLDLNCHVCTLGEGGGGLM